MTIEKFSANHRLKTRLDECGDKIIPGRNGQIYEWSEDELGVMFMPPKTKEHPWGRWTPRKWGFFKRLALSQGMTLRQNGDSEGCLSFDPSDQKQAKLAIRIARIIAKRKVSSEQIERLRRTQFKPAVE